jgi:predicted nucleic acid-binding protein
MIECPDVNILVYAHRSELEQHLFCITWLEDKLNGSLRILNTGVK